MCGDCAIILNQELKKQDELKMQNLAEELKEVFEILQRFNAHAKLYTQMQVKENRKKNPESFC